MMKKPILVVLVVGLFVLVGILWAKNAKQSGDLANLVGNTNLSASEGNSGNLAGGNSGAPFNNTTGLNTAGSSTNDDVEKFSQINKGPTPTNPPDRHAERINTLILLQEQPTSPN